MIQHENCVARCVRRAFLCGIDEFSGQNYEHRREWIVTKLKSLTNIFSIDICAYAVMSNHYHVILHVDTDQAAAWSQGEVIEQGSEDTGSEDTHRTVATSPRFR